MSKKSLTKNILKGLVLTVALIAMFALPNKAQAMNGFMDDIVFQFNGGTNGNELSPGGGDVCGGCHNDWGGRETRSNMAVLYYIYDNNAQTSGDGAVEVNTGGNSVSYPGYSSFMDIDSDMDGMDNYTELTNAETAANGDGDWWPNYPDKDGDGFIQLLYRQDANGMPNAIPLLGDAYIGADLVVAPMGWDIDDNDPSQGGSDGHTQGWPTAKNGSMVIGSTSDTYPPEAITDFRAGTMSSATELTTQWSAPADDDPAGAGPDTAVGAHNYDMRFTTYTIANGKGYNVANPAHWVTMFDLCDGDVDVSTGFCLKKSGGVVGTLAGTAWNMGTANTPLMRAIGEPVPNATVGATDSHTIKSLGVASPWTPISGGTTYWMINGVSDGVLKPTGGTAGEMFEDPTGFTENFSFSNITAITAGNGSSSGDYISAVSPTAVTTASGNAMTIDGEFYSTITSVSLFSSTGVETACTGVAYSSTQVTASCSPPSDGQYGISVGTGAGATNVKAFYGDVLTSAPGAGDSTAPTGMGTVVASIESGSYVPGTNIGGFTISTTFTEAESTPTCEYATTGADWAAGNISGGPSTWTCTSPTINKADTTSLTLNIRATSPGGGPTTASSIARTVDDAGPNISAFTATAGNNQCDLAWTIADGGSGLPGAGTFTVYRDPSAYPGCAGGQVSGSPFGSGTSVNTDTGAVNPNTYYYTICTLDNFGSTSNQNASATCSPSAGPTTTAQGGATGAPDVTTNAGSSVLSSSFALISSGSAVNVTGITVAATLSGLADGDFSDISLYLDNGSTAGEWDGTDSAVTNGTGGTLSGGSVTFGSVNETTLVGTPTEYVIKATLVASPSADGTASFNVSAIASTQGTGSSDTGESTLSLDTVAPNTVVLSSPALSTWFAANQSVTLTVQDTAGTNNTGVASTDYCMDDDTASCTPGSSYGGTIDVTCPAGQVCQREVGFGSTDNVGNVQTTVYQEPIWIDKQGPSITSFIITGSSSSNCAMSWAGSADNGVSTIAATGSIWRETSTGQGCTGTEVDASAIKGASTSDDTTVPSAGTYYYTFCLDDTLSNTGMTEISCSAQDATTTGTKDATTDATPGFTYVKGGETEVELGTFKIATTDASDDITAIDLTFTGADGDYAGSSVKVFLDANKDGIKDVGETTQIGSTGSVSGLALSISGFTVDATLNNEYVIVANIAATPASADGTNLQAKSVGTTKTNGATVWSNTDAYDGAVTVDKTNATGTATITDDTGGFNADNLVNITISCADTTAGCAQMRVSNSSTYSDDSWEAVANKTDWPLTNVEGSQTVYVWYKDNAGNVSTSGGGDASDSTYIDKSAPSGTVTINGTHDPYTNSATLDSTISGVTDGSGSGCVDIETSQDGTSGWTSVGNCTGPINTWTHGCAEGSCDIFVRFIDSVGNVSGSFSDATTYDVTQPSATTDPADSATNVAIGQLITVNFSNGPIDCATVTANTTVSISGAGCQAGNLTKDSCSDTVAEFSHPTFGTGAACTLDVSTGVKDQAGNALSPAVSNSFDVSSSSETTSPNFSTGTGEAISGADKGGGTTVTISFEEATDPAEAGSTAQVDIKYDICQTQASGGCDGGSFTANAASNVAGVGTNAIITQDVTGLNEGEIYYFKVKAKDQSANETIHDTEIKAIPYDRTLGFTGYNMLSVPGELGAGIAFSTLFGSDDLSTLRTYAYAGGYIAAANAEEGKGYWVLNRSGTPIVDTDAAGSDCGDYAGCYTAQSTAGTPDVSVAVSPGWNLVGNPCLTNLMGSSTVNNGNATDAVGYIDVTYNSGTMSFGDAVTNNYIKNTVYRWNGTNYADAPNLVDGSGALTPWSGYWFFVRNALLTDIRYNCGTQ